jgi:transcription termination factor NusB
MTKLINDEFLTQRVRNSRMVAINIAFLYLSKIRENKLVHIPLISHGAFIKGLAHDIFMSYRYFINFESIDKGTGSKVDENFVIKLIYNLNQYQTYCIHIQKHLKGDWTTDNIDLKLLSILIIAYKEFTDITNTTGKNYKAILTSEYVNLTSMVFKNHNGVIKFANGVLDSLLK